MHDIDRTQLEGWWETAPYGNGEFEEEFYGGLSGETYDDEFEYGDEFEYEDEYGYGYEYEYEAPGPLDEADEMDLAAQLLEITDEYELDQFLGKVFKKVGRALPASVRGRLGKTLRGIAKRALPIAGGLIGGPAGGLVTSQAGRLLGLELEGLSPEDKEFEVARGFVRLASEVAQQAAMAPAGAPPQAVAKQAVAAAAQKHAPGLIRAQKGGPQMRGRRPRPQRGTWVRRGGSIILFGVNR